jgi:hypothetical protein
MDYIQITNWKKSTLESKTVLGTLEYSKSFFSPIVEYMVHLLEWIFRFGSSGPQTEQANFELS